MKIIVSTPLAGDKVSTLLDGYSHNGITYRLLGRHGIRIEFDVTGIYGQDAIDLTKRLIRDTDFGNVLYFQIIAG